jgi:hypothetical protein
VIEPNADKPTGKGWTRRNLWWLAPLAVVVVVLGSVLAVAVFRSPASSAKCAQFVPPAPSASATGYDRYPAWPPTGTTATFGDEAPFCANAIVVLSCRGHMWNLYPKSLVGAEVPTTRIQFTWYDDLGPQTCAAKWPAQDQTRVKTLVLEYIDGAPTNGSPAWTTTQTVYSADNTNSMTVRSGTKDIAVVLINFTDQKPGFLVPYGPNGIQAPPKGFMS